MDVFFRSHGFKIVPWAYRYPSRPLPTSPDPKKNGKHLEKDEKGVERDRDRNPWPPVDF